MSKLPLDLSKFRKVASDEHTSTFRHYEGHEIKVAHKKLSSKMRQQLDKLPTAKPKKMADGGQTTAPTLGSVIGYPGSTQTAPVDKQKAKAMKDGGTVNSESSQDSPDQIAMDAAHQNLIADSGEIENDASPMQIDGVSIPDNRSIGEKTANILWGGGKPPPAETRGTLSPKWEPPSQTPQTDLQAQGPATTMPPATSNDPFGTLSSLNQQMHGIQTVGAGQQAEAKAIGEQGAQNLAQEQNYQQQSDKDLQAYNEANAPLIQERQALINDIQKGHIDPKRYLDNMSTGGKIATGIGLILGGMGAGLTHGPNLAFKYLQDQIDRDINSQRDDLGKKENLLSHNFHQTGDLRQAYSLTKIHTNDVLASHLRMVADQTADPVAKASMLQIAGMTDQQTAQIQHQLAMTKMQSAAFSGQGGPGAGMALETLPAEMRERAVQLPGGGMRLGITKDGAKEVREQIQSVQPIFDSLNKLQSLGPSALVPGSPANQTAQAIRAQLIPLVNENAGLKRLSAEDIGNIKQMFNDPTHFSSLFSAAKTNAFKQFLQDKLMNSMGSQLEGGAGTGRPAASGNFGFKPRKS